MNEALSISSLTSVQNGTGASSVVSSVETSREARSAGQTSFSDVLTDTGEQFVASLTNAERSSIAGIKGEVGPYEVVSTVMEAEQQLRMVTAVRDRMVQAYMEISRMQI